MDNKKNAIILIAIIAVLLVIGGVCFGFVLINKGNNAIATTINTTMDLVDEIIKECKKEIEDLEDKTISAKLDVKLDLDLNDNVITDEKMKTIQSKLNDTDLTLNVKMNQKQKLMQMILNLGVEGKELINGDIVANKETGYLKIKDILEKYVEVELTEDVWATYDNLEIYNDIEVIYDAIDPVIRKAILKGEINKEKAEIEIDGEKIKVNKQTLILDEKLANEISLAVLETIKENDEVINSIVKVSNYLEEDIEKEDFIEDINYEIEYIKDELEYINESEEYEGEELYFSVYTKGFIAKAIQYTLYDENEEGITLKVLDDNKFVCNAIIDGEKLFEIEGICEKENIELNITLEEFKGKIVYKTEDKEKEHLELYLDTGDELIGSIGIILDSTVDVSKKQLEIDTSDSIGADEISEDVSGKIQIKLEEVLGAYGLTLEDLYFLSMLGF